MIWQCLIKSSSCPIVINGALDHTGLHKGKERPYLLENPQNAFWKGTFNLLTHVLLIHPDCRKYYMWSPVIIYNPHPTSDWFPFPFFPSSCLGVFFAPLACLLGISIQIRIFVKLLLDKVLYKSNGNESKWNGTGGDVCIVFDRKLARMVHRATG